MASDDMRLYLDAFGGSANTLEDSHFIKAGIAMLPELPVTSRICPNAAALHMSGA